MGRLPNNARLQDRILLALRHETATSVTEIARRLSALRPSVSRSLAALERNRLVKRDGRRWSLTDLGRSEVRELEKTLPEKSAVAISAIAKALDQQRRLVDVLNPAATRSMFGFAKIVPTVLPDLTAPQRSLALAVDMLPKRSFVTEFSDLNAAVTRLNDQFSAQVLVKDIWENLGLHNSIAELAKVQSLNLSWLSNEQLGLSPGISALLSENNATVARILADFGALGSLRIGTNMVDLARETARATQAFHRYFRESAEHLQNWVDRDSWTIPTTLAREIVIPSNTTATLVGGVRALVEEHQAGEDVFQQTAPFTESKGLWLQRAAAFDEALASFGARFARKWNGAWTTLISGSQDCVSQAAHSGRELLMQLLEELAPDSVFTEEDCAKYGHKRRPTKTMRVKYVLGVTPSENAAEWVVSIIETVDKVYEVLVAETHRRSDEVPYDPAQISGILMSLGGLLQYLIASYQANRSLH